jgi:hypothetical protein
MKLCYGRAWSWLAQLEETKIEGAASEAEAATKKREEEATLATGEGQAR